MSYSKFKSLFLIKFWGVYCSKFKSLVLINFRGVYTSASATMSFFWWSCRAICSLASLYSLLVTIMLCWLTAFSSSCFFFNSARISSPGSSSGLSSGSRIPGYIHTIKCINLTKNTFVHKYWLSSCQGTLFKQYTINRTRPVSGGF